MRGSSVILRWGLVWALGTLLMVPAGASAADQWVKRTIDESVEFSGESRDCRPTADVHDFDLPLRIRNLDVDSPEGRERLRADGPNASARVTYIGVKRDNDRYELSIGVIGVACQAGRNRWSADLDIKVEYEELVSTFGPGVARPPSPPVAPSPPPVARLRCGVQLPKIRQIEGLRTTCVTARSVARRYLLTLRSRRVHRVMPYTCFDHAVPGGRKVTCRASGRRFVWFRYTPR